MVLLLLTFSLITVMSICYSLKIIENKLFLENVENLIAGDGEKVKNGGGECSSSFQYTPGLSPYLLADS